MKINYLPHEKETAKLHEEKGASAVYDYANENNMQWEHCYQCDAETPIITGEGLKFCACCGGETTPTPEEEMQYLTHSQKEKIFSNVAEHSQYTIKTALDSLRYKYLNNTSQWTESDYRQFAREQVNATLLKVVAEQMESQSKMNS